MAKAAKATAGKAAKGGYRSSAQPVVPAENMSVARKIAWYSLLAMVFLVPIAIGNFTWLGFKMPITYDQFDIVKVFVQRVLGLIALGAWSWDMLTTGGKIRRTPVDWLILAFLGWVALTTFTSFHPPTAFFGKYRRFEGFLSFLNYAVIYFLVLQFADRPSRVKTLAQTLFWSGVIVAGYGVLQSVGYDMIKWGQLPFEVNRSFSTYGNPDLLGGFLMFSIPITLGLALSEARMNWRLVYWAGMLLNVWCWITAFTRGAWIGGFVSVAFVIFFAWRHSAKMSKVDWIPVGGIAAVGATLIGRSLSNPNEVMNFGRRFASIIDFQGGSGKTRTEIWQAAIDAIKDRPLFGFGADTFRLVFPKYKPVEYVKDAGYLSVADNVHDYPLQLAAGIGIIGMLLMYGVFAWAAIRSAPAVFKKTDDAKRILLGAFWAACAGYLVQLMFGLSVTGNTFLLWTAMAVVLAPTASIIEFKAPSWGLAASAVILIAVGLGVGYQFVIIQADNAYLNARIALRGAERTASAMRAVKLNPFNDMYRAEVGLALTDETLDYINQAQQAQQSQQDPQALILQAQQKFNAAEASLRETIAFVPPEYDNYVFLANLYNMGAQVFSQPQFYVKADEAAKQGILVERFGPAIRVQRARALLGQNKQPEAIKELETAFGMDNAYTEAALLLSQLYEQAGRSGQALIVLKRTEAVKSGQAGIAEAITRLESAAASATTPTP
jgi:O-antigen ligase